MDTACRFLIRSALPALAALLAPGLAAAAPRALPEGQLPQDARLAEPVTLHGYHPLRPVEGKEHWESRRRDIRDRIQIASGLWPMPTRTPLNAVIHGKVDRGDYTVERVYFESMPGHFVTGSLFRPAGESLALAEKEGKRPVVLCPHGHWNNGRFYDAGRPAALREIAMGGERFLTAAHNPVVARCVQLARMGCVAFLFDMIGYADSIQFPEHRNGPRERMNSAEPGQWGFISPQSTGRLQTNFGLQTWNSVRALDFLLSLEEADPGRVLVTGASGGATQTMMMGAIDERVDAIFPCVMVSTAMQGGCTCENTHLLRIGQGNIDIAAAAAPLPQGLTAADDWTRELETKGHPDLLRVYELAGAAGAYEAHFDIHFKHNYNHVSRTHMYQFANRHLGLGLESPVLERDFEPLEREDLTVWTEDHPAPSGDQTGDAHEREVNRWWAEDSDAQVAALLAPANAEGLRQSRAVLGRAAEILIGRSMPEAGATSFGLAGKEERPGYLEMTGMITHEAEGEEIPAAFLFPGKDRWKGKVALWISAEGKAGLFEGDAGTPREAARELLDRGIAVVGLDLFKQGEFLNPGEEAAENPRITYSGDRELPEDSWQRSSVYFYGYNHSLFARRVHDILTAASWLRSQPDWEVTELSLAGESGAGHWVAAARALAGGAIDKAVVDTGGFRFGALPSDWHADFLPGAVKYGDLAGFLALSAPHPLMLADPDAALLETARAAYRAAGAEDALRPGQDVAAMVSFLAE